MKKKMILMLAVLVLVCLAFVACSGDTQSEPVPSPEPTPVETAPLTEDKAPEAPSLFPSGETEDSTVGVITGNMFYKDIEIALLFEKPFAALLGTPLSEQRGHFFFYDGLEILANWNSLTSLYDMTGAITGTNLALFEIDGITLDKTRAELIATFGDPVFYLYPDFPYWNPNDPDDYRWLGYHIWLNGFEYRIEFWFDQPDDIAHNFLLRRMD